MIRRLSLAQFFQVVTPSYDASINLLLNSWHEGGAQPLTLSHLKCLGQCRAKSLSLLLQGSLAMRSRSPSLFSWHTSGKTLLVQKVRDNSTAARQFWISGLSMVMFTGG